MSLVAGGCGGGDDPASRSAAASATPTARPSAGAPASGASAPASGASAAASEAALRPVRLQLPWARQARFAGYIAALTQGFYEEAGLAVTIVEGDSEDASVAAASAPDGPEFAVATVPAALHGRVAAGSDLVEIAQLFQRSGTLSISWRDRDVTRAADLRGQVVGVPGAGSDFEVTAGAIRAGLVPGTDYTTLPQGMTVDAFLQGGIGVAQVAIYDGYAQVLETADPTSGSLYQPTDLNVINWNDEGTAMLQDAVFARGAWLADDDHADLAVDFLRASFLGWLSCRKDPETCVRLTVESGTARGAGHQAWMLQEVQGLIWPSPGAIGVLDEDAWQATVATLRETALLPSDPGPAAFRTDLAAAALAQLVGEDLTGDTFIKGTVDVTPGGA